MTVMTFQMKGGHPVGFTCVGHSGYAEAGQDIVCAAISAMTQLVIGYAEKYRLSVSVLMEEEDGMMECRMKEECEEFKRLLATLRDACNEIASQYPTHFTVKSTEV